ncbi:MAG: hypothetical protein CMIDDMOC_00438 [Sodalis sp. Fle]|nr:MAG: hypothetical protein CMIDDMOC_00438 [Sodalis sp. Fle]
MQKLLSKEDINNETDDRHRCLYEKKDHCPLGRIDVPGNADKNKALANQRLTGNNEIRKKINYHRRDMVERSIS